MTTLAPTRPAPDLSRVVGWAPLLVVLTGTFVTFLDFFIVNVGLPSMQADLHAGPSAISLVVAGFGLSFAAGMITGGRLGDLYGRRRMFAIGLTLFTLASVACGLAPTAGVLVGARVAQGAAGALVTPQVLAILGTVYAGPRRGTAFAAYGFVMGVAGVLGQLIGGALIQADLFGLGWRSIFLINLPVGLVAVPLTLRLVPESRGQAARLDLAGVLIGSAAITAVVLPLVEGRQQGWPAWTWASIAAAPLLLLGFVVHQRSRTRRNRPVLVHLHLFRTRSFAAGCGAAVAFGMVPPALFFVLALYLQDGRGYSALTSGVVFIAVGVGYFAALLSAQQVAARAGQQVLAVGATLCAVGAIALAATAHATSAWALTPGLTLAGFGIGTVLVPMTSAVLAGIEPALAGAAAGVLSTAQQIGGALGVAVIGGVYFGHGEAHGAFAVSAEVIAGLTVATILLSQLLRTSKP